MMMTTEIFEEISLLMKGPLVLATLADRKTMTRRHITQRNSLIDGRVPTKKAWEELDWSDHDRIHADPGPSPTGNPGPYLKVPNVDGDRWHRVYPRVQPGTRIWVRESFWASTETMARRDPVNVIYLTDTVTKYAGSKPSIHMPRWACRLELDTTKVRIERLNDISYEDALAEGVADMRPMIADECRDGETADQCARRLRWPQREFQLLW